MINRIIVKKYEMHSIHLTDCYFIPHLNGSLVGKFTDGSHPEYVKGRELTVNMGAILKVTKTANDKYVMHSARTMYEIVSMSDILKENIHSFEYYLKHIMENPVAPETIYHVVMTECFIVEYRGEFICGKFTSGYHPNCKVGSYIDVNMAGIIKVTKNSDGNYVLYSRRSSYEISSTNNMSEENTAFLQECIGQKMEETKNN